MYVRPPLPPLSHPPGGRIQGGPHQGHRRRRRHCHEPDRAARLALKRCWRRQAHRRWLHPPSGGWRRHAKFGSAAGGGANRAGMPALADSPSRCTGRSCANAGCMLASLPAPVNRQNDLGALCHSAPLTGLKAPPPLPWAQFQFPNSSCMHAASTPAPLDGWGQAGRRCSLRPSPCPLCGAQRTRPPVPFRSAQPRAVVPFCLHALASLSSSKCLLLYLPLSCVVLPACLPA